jgi:ankyrin repeat protein
MISFLLNNGAYVDSKSKRGTPLHMASLYGYDTVVKILLEKGANVSPSLITYPAHTLIVQM